MADHFNVEVFERSASTQQRDVDVKCRSEVFLEYFTLQIPTKKRFDELISII